MKNIARPEPESMTSRIGDFIISWKTNRPAFSRTGGYESLTAFEDGSEVWTSPTGDHWKGSPIETWTEGTITYWAVGDIPGKQRSINQIHNWPGHFILLGRDIIRQEWHVWTDRMGTFHAYYAWDGQHGAVGSFFPAVASIASCRNLDWLGLCGFFGFGFFPGDRTYYDDVKILRPASHYVFDNHGRLCREERCWRWFHQPDPHRSYSETIEEFAGLFTTILREQTEGRSVALPISGGLDSRSTVAALTNPGTPGEIKYQAYSYGYDPSSVEIKIAGQIAKARQLPFETFVIQPYLFDQIERIFASVEGFQDITQCRQAAVVDWLGNRADYVIAAHWGDVWHDDMDYLKVEKQQTSESIVEHAYHKIKKPGSDWLLHLCEPYLHGVEARTVLRQAVQAEISSLGEITDVDFRIKAYKTEQWSFRWTLPSLRMYQSQVYPLLPFYDPRIVDFFCTVPTEYVRGRRMQIDYLKKYAPDLARINWQPYGTNLYLYPFSNVLTFPGRAISKLQRSLLGLNVTQRNWEKQFLNVRGRLGLYEWLEKPGRKLHDIVPADVMSSMLQNFYHHPNRETGYALSILLTFSTWLEFYG